MKRLYWIFILALSITLANVAYGQDSAEEIEEEFPPISIDLTGTVSEIDEESGAIILDGVTIWLNLTDLPDDIQITIGAPITISGQLLEDGTIEAEIIIPATPEEIEDSEDGESEGSDDGEGEVEESSCGFSGGEEADSTSTAETEDDGSCHPVLEILSNEFEVSYDELQSLRDENYGIGEIARAYLLAEAAGVEVSAITEMRDSGMGWGQIMKEYPDVHPSQLAPGSVIGNGRGNSVRQETTDSTETQNGNGNGNGNNGNGNGNNGNGNGNGGGNGNGNNGNGNGNGGGNGRK